MSRKLGVNVPWASLLCWSEQRQSCELERGSSSIADNPCLVTESTYIVTVQGGYNPVHTFSFYQFAHVEYASGCYLLDHQPGGIVQDCTGGKCSDGLRGCCTRVQQFKSLGEERAACMVPSRTDTGLLLTREDGVGA